MSKYLVVHFDRYDTDKSVQHFVDAEDSKEAYIKCQQLISKTKLDDDEVDELADDYDESAVQTSEIFTSISEDENDWLIYNLDSVVQKG